VSYYTLGNYDKAKGGHDESYYCERHCLIDYRGDLRVSPLSYFGFGVRVVTQSHALVDGAFYAPAINKTVIVGDYAWVTSYAILYNCTISHHAIVSIGAVVTNMTVPPYTVVAGNPAKPIVRWDLEEKRWIKLSVALDSPELLDI